MTIFVEESVSADTFGEILALVEHEQLYNPAFSGTEISVVRGECTHIDSARRDDYDNIRLLRGVQDIIIEREHA